MVMAVNGLERQQLELWRFSTRTGNFSDVLMTEKGTLNLCSGAKADDAEWVSGVVGLVLAYW